MTKEQTDETVEAETTTDSSPEENEQEPVQTDTASEGEKTQDSDVEKRRLQAALREARERIRTEKAKRLEAEALIGNQPARETLDTGTPEEIQRRFVDTEARSAIGYLYLKDPTIKERLEIIEEIMEKTGKTVEEADKEAKSILYDQVFTTGNSQANLTKTLKPAAVPEETPRKTTGSALKDVQKGLVDVDPELREALKRY